MKVIIPMRTALADEAVLGGALPGPSWRNWKVLLIAAAGEKLTASERKTFHKLTGRRHEPGVMIETLLVVAGRRSGKTKVMAVFSVWLACCVDWSADLSLGERGMSLFLAPTERQAEIAHDYAEAVIDNVELFKAQVVSRTANSIELHGRIELETQAANWRYSRGATAICIVFDESAFLHSGDDAANSDVELLTALRPSLATTGGPMLLTSSPRQMEGAIYAIWKRHHGARGDKRVLVVQAESRVLNPALRKSVVDRAYEENAVTADAEFGGRFRQATAAYLERAVVEKAVDKGVAARVMLPGVTYKSFVDVAGGSGGDSFTAACGHNQHQDGRDVAVVDAALEIRGPFDPDVAVARCSELLKAWGINTIYGDSYASMWPVTAFARHGIIYVASPLSKSELYLHTLPLWTAGRVSLLDLPRAVDQFCALKRKLGSNGREGVDHPRGGHDDVANAISGLLWMLSPTQPAAYLGFGAIVEGTGGKCFGDNPGASGGLSEYAGGYVGANDYAGSSQNPALGLDWSWTRQ